MILTYGTYLDLLTVLDEYTECTLSKEEIQNKIFDHYIQKYGSFIAVNSLGVKQLFYLQYQRTKNNKAKRKQFRNLMNNGKC